MLIGIMSRFRPFAEIGLWVVGAVVALNFVFVGLQAASLLNWLPDRSAGIGYILESRSRVEGAIAAYRAGDVLVDRPLAAVIGISDVREGVRLDVLSERMNGKWRFVGVAGAGAGMSSIVEQAEILTKSDLRPDVAIIGLTPLHFIDVEKLRQGDTVVAQNISAKDRVKGALREAAWIVRRRSDISSWLDSVLLDVRAELLPAPGKADLGSPAHSPWRPLLRTLGAEHYPPDVLKTSLEKLRASGGGQTETYLKGDGIKAAGALIKDLERRQMHVIVVEMPQHSWLRAELPANISNVIMARLKRESGIEDLEALDYSDSIEDGGFIDLVHLNTSGGEDFSRKLAMALSRRALSVHPKNPVMNRSE